jgi:hypothetical protein
MNRRTVATTTQCMAARLMAREVEALKNQDSKPKVD